MSSLSAWMAQVKFSCFDGRREVFAENTGTGFTQARSPLRFLRAQSMKLWYGVCFAPSTGLFSRGFLEVSCPCGRRTGLREPDEIGTQGLLRGGERKDTGFHEFNTCLLLQFRIEGFDFAFNFL